MSPLPWGEGGLLASVGQGRDLAGSSSLRLGMRLVWQESGGHASRGTLVNHDQERCLSGGSAIKGG